MRGCERLLSFYLADAGRDGWLDAGCAVLRSEQMLVQTSESVRRRLLPSPGQLRVYRLPMAGPLF
jgi:hypothetical protein